MKKVEPKTCKKFEFEKRDLSQIISTLALLDYQDSNARIKVSDFSTELLCSSIYLSIEPLMEEFKIVVL